MSDAQIGQGSTIERSSDGKATWAKIPRAKGAPVPKPETEYKDVTNLDSPGGFREFIPGLKSAGEIEISALYTRDGYLQQAADEGLGKLIDYRVTYKSGDLFEFAGYPTVSPDDAEVDAERTMTIKIKISGPVVMTAGGA
jgi:hypothetical protein